MVSTKSCFPWYVCLIVAQGRWALLTRHHQHNVPRYKDDSNPLRAFEARIHQGNWLHTYANSRGCSDTIAAEWVCRKAMQDQYETTTLRTVALRNAWYTVQGRSMSG